MAGGSRGSRGKAETMFCCELLFCWAGQEIERPELPLSKLGECGALAEPSLGVSVNEHSNRAPKSPPASCYFLVWLLADLISPGFASWESSPGF